jgi:hypothetical protein
VAVEIAWFLLSSTLVVLSLIGGLWASFSQEVPPPPWQEWRKGTTTPRRPMVVTRPCAINLYGLPRQFAAMVLPGLRKHVIEVNARYECDYFVHYYDRHEESDYRGVDRGRGGQIDPDEILLLRLAVLDVHTRMNYSSVIPNVTFVKESEETFFDRFGPFLDKIFHYTSADGRLLYLPYSEGEPFPNTTTVNIVKMWHSQEAVWRMMESSSWQEHYSRVAMLRSDVLFVSPVDIYRHPDGSLDHDNRFAVVPNFGNFPVNDRMIYGPYDAVRLWAAGRFQHLDRHVRSTVGDGIHSEKYLSKAIFPLIQDAGVPILKASSDLCFLRVRSDLSLRFQDCGRTCVTPHNLNVVQTILQRNCLLNENNLDVAILECGNSVQKHDLLHGGEALAWEDCPPNPI